MRVSKINRCERRFIQLGDTVMASLSDMLALQKEKVGNTLGPSTSIQITQQMIDQFSETTFDPDPMHIDPAWCKKNSPYPSTISFGFLTMSLLTAMAHDLIKYDRENRIGTGGFPMNYGFNKLRLVAPVLVNSKVYATMTLLDVTERKPGQILQEIGVTTHIEGQEAPALVGNWMGLWITEAHAKEIAAAQ